MSFPHVILTGGRAPRPPLPPSVWSGLEMTWTAASGRVWDLNDFEGGVLLDRRGVEGLHNPPITKYSSASRAIPGKRSRGWRTEARPVFWPVYLYGDSSREWLDRNAEFWDSIHPEIPGTWSVTAFENTRTLELTGVFDSSHIFDLDPMQRGWVQYAVALEAEQPYWAGTKIERGPWAAPESAGFFPGPPFHLSSGSAFADAEVPNPGNVTAYGQWILDGPLTANTVELGVGSAYLTVPFAIPDGETLVIDTDPRRPSALLGDTPALDDQGLSLPFDREAATNMTPTLGMQPFAGIPPASSVPLHVEATGLGSVRFELTPLYLRAF
jgi:hypothetical protein